MRSALVLNASYEPLSVVPARRAACLVLADKAEIIEADGTELRSPSIIARQPARDPAALHGQGAVPPAHGAVAAGRVRPRRLPLPVLRRTRRLDRPRAATVARRAARVGERRRRVPAVQPGQARPHARRGRDAPGPPVPGAAADGVGGGQRGPGARGVEAVPRHRLVIAVGASAAASARQRSTPWRCPTRVELAGVGVRRRAAGARARLGQRPTRSSTSRRARAAGVEVVRRRSGGGAVLLVPGDIVWFDVDRAGRAAARRRGSATTSRRSMVWLGETSPPRSVPSAPAPSTVHDAADVAHAVVADWSASPGSARARCCVDGRKLVGHQPAPDARRGPLPVRRAHAPGRRPLADLLPHAAPGHSRRSPTLPPAVAAALPAAARRRARTP